MKNEMMFGFLIHLSRHFWDDLGAPPRALYGTRTTEDKNNMDIKLWDEVVAELPKYGINTLLIDVGDAVIFDSHPEIAAKDAWTKEFFLQKLDEIRALGMTPLPKLNFSACHDRWLKEYSRMVSSKVYYQVCADLIKECCEMFGNPAYFHLGLDEEDERHQRNCDIIIVRNEALWWHDLNFFCKECEKNGARPWIWANLSYLKYPKTFAQNVPKSCILTNGYHGNYAAPTELSEKFQKSEVYHQAHLFYNENGYDQIPLCSVWDARNNAFQVLAIAKNELNPDLIKGFIMAPWFHVNRCERHGMLMGAETLLCAREKYYPETLE